MQIDEFLSDIERRMSNLVRTGIVIEVLDAKVKIKTSNLITKFLPYLTQRAGDCETWWSPSIGEQVLILSPCGELNNGIVLPAIPTKDYQIHDTKKHVIQYADGTSITYDYENQILDINAVDTVKIKANKIILDSNVEIAGNTVISGNNTVAGNITSNGDVVASGKSLIHHTHTDAESRGTSKPN